MISIETQGSPYERGAQHGERCAALVHTVVAGYKDKGKFSLCPLAALRKIERFFPAMIREMEGIADGAGIPRDEIFRLNLQQLEAAPACSVVGVRDQDGNPWIAKTDDIGADEVGWNILERATTSEGVASLNLRFAGTVWTSTAYVENGFCMAMTGLPGGFGPPDAVPYMALLPLLPSRCTTTEEALALLEEFELDYGGFSLLLADAKQQAVLVEKTSQGQSSRELEFGSTAAMLCHTNHCCFGTLTDPLDSLDTPLARNSRDRLRVISDLASKSCHSPEGLQQLLRDHTDPGAICQHGGSGLHTDYAVVLSPSLGGIYLSEGPACGHPFGFHSVTASKVANAKSH